MFRPVGKFYAGVWFFDKKKRWSSGLFKNISALFGER
jgi:hypothetical protein